MDEVFKIADKVTVFRDGKHVATLPAAELDRQKLITLMVGRELTHLFPKEDVEIGEVVMSVRGLTRNGVISDISFDLRRGEILGLAGLMGAGRTEVLEAIFGVDQDRCRRDHHQRGKTVQIKAARRRHRGRDGPADRGPQADRHHGRAVRPRQHDDREPQPRSARAASSASARWRRPARASARRWRIKTPSLAQLIRNLSGGNQQKVLVSRWLLTLPDILMIDEPTRGIDVGAKSEIHRLMSGLAKEGKAILMVSSEMPEILGMSDRVLVMAGGRITAELSRAEVTQEKVLEAATARRARGLRRRDR